MSFTIDSSSRYFIVVRDEKGKKRRVEVDGTYVSFNAACGRADWIEGARMPVLRCEVETGGEVFPLLPDERTATMEIW